MSARLNFALPLASALAFAGFLSLSPGAALAGAPPGGCCKPPPPPCCKPPPSPPPCCAGGHKINIPNVNVNVGATVIVNASATAIGSASASANAFGGTTVFGGGGSSVIFSPGNVGLIGGLNVEGGKRRAAYSAKRTKIKIVVIRAVCVDDREIPHPASQVTPDKELSEMFEGEIFRCVAGARLQITMSDWEKRVDFERGAPGEIMNCAKGEALWRSRSGEMTCRPATPQRNCFERSLLRRYGAGIKIVKIVTEETYTAYREESVESASAGTINMTVDGGVGGIVH